MSRRFIKDKIWAKIQQSMKFYGRYRSRTSKNIMQDILWSLLTSAAWPDIPEDLCPCQTSYVWFNRWVSKELWESFLKLREVLNKASVNEDPFLIQYAS